MAVLSPLAAPTSQAYNPLQQGAQTVKADPAKTRTVNPIDTSERSGASRTGVNEGMPGNASEKSIGVNGSRDSERGKAQTGLLTKAANTAADGKRESRDAHRTEVLERSRARSTGKSYERGASAVETVIKAAPNTKLSEVVGRPQVTPQDEARINTQRFVATLEKVREAEAPVANDNDRPVALNTNDSSEAVGRYDKSA